MSLHEEDRKLIREAIKLMSDNLTALADLQAAVVDNTTATNAAIAAGIGGGSGAPDISAGVESAVAMIQQNTADLVAATPVPVPASSTPTDTPSTPVETGTTPTAV